MGPRKQPGQLWTFKCGHSGILPPRGESNKAVLWWNSRSSSSGGNHVCRPCQLVQDRRRKKRTSALFGLTWAKRLLVSQKAAARHGKYTPPNISAAQIVELKNTPWLTCCICQTGKELKWVKSARLTNPHLHHNHDTGEVYGFAHALCNRLAGLLDKKLTPELQAEFFKRACPRAFDLLVRNLPKRKA
jgi:hypothetical protein